MNQPLETNYFLAPDDGRRDSWIDYVRDVLLDCTREDIGDAYSNNDAYPISDYAAPGKTGLLEWLNDSVDRLAADHRHVDLIRPHGLTLDGEPAVLVVASADAPTECASAAATAFALISWIVTERQCQDRHHVAA